MNLSLDWTVFIQFSFFLASYWALKTLFFPPVLEVLERRKKMIEQANQELRRHDAEGKRMQEEYKARLREARQQAQEIHNKARFEAAEEDRKIMEEARKEATALLKEGEAQLEEARQTAFDELDEQRHELASLLVEKTLGHTVSS